MKYEPEVEVVKKLRSSDFGLPVSFTLSPQIPATIHQPAHVLFGISLLHRQVFPEIRVRFGCYPTLASFLDTIYKNMERFLAF